VTVTSSATRPAERRLGLGTVQFGFDYGVSNRAGRPDEGEVAAILARAVEAGVGYLDTAPAYGDAERLVGRQMPRGHGLRIVTKLPAIREPRIEACHGEGLLASVAASLERLRVDAVHGLLLHDAADLGKPGWQHVVEALNEASSRGWAGRIGASVYDIDQLALVESRFRPGLVQVPVNAFDRRLVTQGVLVRLKANDIEIHARSAFLQGLLLMPPADLPGFFEPVHAHLAAIRARWDGQGVAPLAGCVAFVLQQPEIDAVIVGVNRRSEFDEILDAVRDPRPVDVGPDPAVDSRYLDPSHWPAFAS
jgi:aryl-alcohol dehydrogenase-like predicted oxidoreductase